MKNKKSIIIWSSIIIIIFLTLPLPIPMIINMSAVELDRQGNFVKDVSLKIRGFKLIYLIKKDEFKSDIIIDMDEEHRDRYTILSSPFKRDNKSNEWLINGFYYSGKDNESFIATLYTNDNLKSLAILSNFGLNKKYIRFVACKKDEIDIEKIFKDATTYCDL